MPIFGDRMMTRCAGRLTPAASVDVATKTLESRQRREADIREVKFGTELQRTEFSRVSSRRRQRFMHAFNDEGGRQRFQLDKIRV